MLIKSAVFLTMQLVMLLSDLLALVCGGMFSVYLRHLLHGQFQLSFYWEHWPVLAFFLLSYAMAGLYPGILISPPEELKKTTLATSTGFVLLAIGVFLTKGSELYSRGIFFMAWMSLLILVPTFRMITRRICTGQRWWGYPAIILGAGESGTIVVNTLKVRPRLGVRPVALLDDDSRKQGTTIHGVPVLGGLSKAGELSRAWSNPIAILAMPGLKPAHTRRIIELNCSRFRRIIVVPDLFECSSLWVKTVDFGGILGFDVVQKLVDKKRQAFKRIFDLCMITLALPVLVPVCIILALAIKLDSRGPVFFRHQRVRTRETFFHVLKFRTMVPDADQVLADYLAEDPELRREWEAKHKLKHDPRITRVGRFLRRSSLDELPQIWNVITGDLSLIGPRPIVEEEIKRYQKAFRLYEKVRPGITGLWQISGRNNTSYDERVDLDTYYVRNWSLWFDIYILAMTPAAVIKGNGAC
jgi:Undecaprenyl-phosphate galactose phosphotransferase WbaP